jgi:hypothetical protein
MSNIICNSRWGIYFAVSITAMLEILYSHSAIAEIRQVSEFPRNENTASDLQPVAEEIAQQPTSTDPTTF